MGASSTEAVRAVVAPVVAAAGLDLEDLTVAAAGRRRQLVVTVDKDGGVSLEDTAAVAGAISAALDETDVMGPGAYVLEISSPGVGRPLTQPRHWRRATGRLVSLTTRDGQSLTGRLVGAEEDRVLVEVDGAVRGVTLAEVTRARVEVEFRHADAGAVDADDPEAHGDGERDEGHDDEGQDDEGQDDEDTGETGLDVGRHGEVDGGR